MFTKVVQQINQIDHLSSTKHTSSLHLLNLTSQSSTIKSTNLQLTRSFPSTIPHTSTIPGTLWLQRMNKMNKHLSELNELESKRMYIGTRQERTLNCNSANSLCSGDIRLRNIRKTLNSLGILRSEDQILFHEAFIAASLPHIYQKDWDSNSVRVMKEFNVDKIRYEVLCMTPRRWGKTWSVATFVLSMLLCVPGVRLAIFSTGKRASGGLLQIINDFLQKIPGGRERVIKSNQEELFIGPPGYQKANSSGRASISKISEEGASVSKLYSYPSSVTGLSTHTHTHTHKRVFHSI